MEYEKKQCHINRILAGGFFCEILDNAYFVDFRLSPMVKQRIDYECLTMYKKAEQNGIEKEKDLLKKLIIKDKWSIEKENVVKTTVEKINVLKNKYYDNFYNEKEKNGLKIAISRLYDEIALNLYEKATLLDGQTIESLVNRCKKRCKYIEMVKDLAGNKISDEIVLKKDFILCLGEKINENSIEKEVLREIARTNPWRILWTNGKSSVRDIFGVYLNELSDEQIELCYWSNFYDNIFNAYEKPNSDIINDDIAIDVWVERECEKQKKDSEKSHAVSEKVGKHKEIFIKTDKASAGKVYSMNDKMTRNAIQTRNKAIKDTSSISEKDLIRKIGKINAGLFVEDKRKK